MSILNKLAKYRQASNFQFQAKTEMTDEQFKALNIKLRAENRVNVNANRKDISVPYRVQMSIGGTWERPQGYFRSLEVAALAGTLVSIARFGDKAIVGTFAESAVSDPEFVSWINNPANASVKKETSELFDEGMF